MKRLVALLLLASCCAPPAPNPRLPTDTPNCAAACDRLRQLGCPEGEALEDGTTCTRFCEDTQQSGHALNATCVMTITNCSSIDSCTVR